MPNDAQALTNARTMGRTFSRFALCGAAASLALLAVQQADARPGGGARTGGGISAPPGGGLGGLRAGAGAPQHTAGLKVQRPGTGKGQGPSAAAGQGQGTFGQRKDQFGANSNAANGGPPISGIAGSANGNAVNNGTVGSGNGNTGVVNTGNVAVGNDVDVDVNNGWGGAYGYGAGAAYATGVAVGTTATAAAAKRAYYSNLPAGCSPYYYSSYRYYSCDGTWYQQRDRGSSIIYVVVSDPTKK